MILPISLYGDPVLRAKAKLVPKSTNIDKLLKDMQDTMYHVNGIGIAAPQIGRSLQIFVIDAPLKYERDHKEKNCKKIIINPVVNIDNNVDTNTKSEGCLSIPDIMVEVPRKEKLTISYYDADWQKCVENYEGFIARVILHEYDHLIGALHIDYLSPQSRKLINSKLEKIKELNPFK